jgi:hypothetical protein
VPLLILVLFSATNAYSQNSTIKIVSKNIPTKLFPGKHYVMLFKVSNTTDKTQLLNCNLTAPDGFKFITSSKKITLKPKSEKNLTFTFSVSKYCNSGNYKSTINILRDNEIVTSENIELAVSKLYHIDVQLLSHPDYLRLEKEFYCEYLVSNFGNSSEKIKFKSHNSFKITPDLVTLKPDSAVMVKVFQKVPVTPFNKTTILNNLQAKLISYDTIFSNRVPITVYPSNNIKPDIYQRFPITISTIFNSLKGIDNINVFKFRIKGNSFIDSEKKHYLGFDYSGPNQPKIVRFGEFETYSALYKFSNFKALIGDVSFSLSNITETSRYGRGGIFDYKFDKLEASFFYIKPRFTKQISDSYGAKFLYHLNDKTNLQLGLINRSLHENNISFNSQLYSLSSTYKNKNITLNGETAFENNNSTNGFAFSLDSYLDFSKLLFSNTIQYSDKDYKGYLRNSKLLLSNLNYKLSNKLTTSLSANYTSVNPVQDTINYQSSSILTKYQASISYNLNKNNKLKVGAYIRTKEDRLPAKSFNFEEKLINISYHNKKATLYNFSFYNRFGKTINLLANSAEPKSVFFSSMQFSLNFNKNLMVGINGDYQQTNKQSEENELLQYFFYGGFLNYSFRSFLDLTLFYKNDYDLDELDDPQSYLEAQLNINYKQKHLFSLSVSQTSIPITPLKKELLLTASYSFVLNTPLFKNKTIGSLRGKISSKKNDTLEGVILSLEDKIAISNEKGEFVFYNLNPKTYFLNVQRSSLPKGKIVLEKMPYQIDITPNKETNIILNLGETGTLLGTVNFKKTNTTQSQKFLKKLPNLIVKIYNNTSENYYTKIDDKGNFEFKELTPGDWTVELLVKNLIKDFTFSATKATIVITPENNSYVKFNVSNKNRKIKKSKKAFKL